MEVQDVQNCIVVATEAVSDIGDLLYAFNRRL